MPSVSRQIAGLAHQDAPTSEIERTCQENFIALRLAMALPFMALAPIFLLVGGKPSIWDALAFLCLMAPLAGVFVLSRTGRMEVAQAICAVAMVVLGVTLTVSHGGLTAGAVACFVLAPLETAIGVATSLALGAATASLGAIVILSVAAATGWMSPNLQPSSPADMTIIAPAVIYGALLAVWSAKTGALREKRAQIGDASYRDLSETIGDLVIKLDRTGSVTYSSADPAGAFRFASRDLAGRGLFERILVSDRPTFLKTVADAAKANATVATEFRLRVDAREQAHSEPVFIWVEMRAHRSNAPDGAVLAVMRDISKLKASQQEIEAAREAAEQANSWKDRFLANVSHELRTPLNAIIGFSEMLGDAKLVPTGSDRQREYANIIHASGEHLLSVVNQILDMSKIETGNFVIEPEHFEIQALIDSCCDMVKLKAQEKHIQLKRAVSPNLQEIVADKRACKQILLNLVSNAVKFTPDGGAVDVSARAQAGYVEICVADTGIGIAPGDLPQLGAPFFQAKSTYDRPYEGTGLGLSVVRGLVGLHGGSMSIASAPGEGSVVTVRLPLDGVDTSARAVQPVRIEVFERRARRTDEIIRSQDQVKKIA